MKEQAYYKITITDDPATWPKEGEFTYMDEDMAAKFRRNDPYCFVDSWWLKPIDLDAVRVKVWDEGYREGCCDGFHNKTKNPYKKKEQK